MKKQKVKQGFLNSHKVFIVTLLNLNKIWKVIEIGFGYPNIFQVESYYKEGIVE